MREYIDIIESAQTSLIDRLADYEGEAIKDDCTKCIPDEISFADFAFVWWVGGDPETMEAKRDAFTKAEETAAIEHVPHCEMTTGQQCVNPDKIKSILARPIDETSEENLPVIHRWNGYHILFDGNHRVTADVLRGQDSSRCRVIELDPHFDQDGKLK